MHTISQLANPTAQAALWDVVDRIATKYCVAHHETGGCFRFASDDGSLNLLRVVDIDLTLEMGDKTAHFSSEKISRLREHPEHKASWLSRDVSALQYGGAIKIEGGYLSFSGAPEHIDELICICVAHFFGWLSKEEALSIARETGNPYVTAEVLDSKF